MDVGGVRRFSSLITLLVVSVYDASGLIISPGDRGCLSGSSYPASQQDPVVAMALHLIVMYKKLARPVQCSSLVPHLLSLDWTLAIVFGFYDKAAPAVIAAQAVM